jgi:hypothetical protein
MFDFINRTEDKGAAPKYGQHFFSVSVRRDLLSHFSVQNKFRRQIFAGKFSQAN